MEFAQKTVNNKKVLDPYSKTILRDLMDKYGVDGVIDMKKIEDSFTPAEKKYLGIIDKVNQSLANKAVYISGSLHGNKINLLNEKVGLSSSEIEQLKEKYTRINTSTLSQLTRLGLDKKKRLCKNYLKVFERFDEKRNEKLNEITELIKK